MFTDAGEKLTKVNLVVIEGRVCIAKVCTNGATTRYWVVLGTGSMTTLLEEYMKTHKGRPCDAQSLRDGRREMWPPPLGRHFLVGHVGLRSYDVSKAITIGRTTLAYPKVSIHHFSHALHGFCRPIGMIIHNRGLQPPSTS